MNKEEQNNSDTNCEYDEESFDNESSEEEISSVEDEDSISEESSAGQSMDELLPDDSSIKSLLDSVANNQTFEENYNDADAASVSSEVSQKSDDKISHSKIDENNEECEMKTSINTNSHEIEESDSDDLAEENLPESIKSLTLKKDENSVETVVRDEEIVKFLEKEDEEPISSCNQSEIEFVVTSQTPASFDSEDYAFHMTITPKPTRSNISIQPQRSRNAHRKSLSFSNERMREIERHNQILLRKILTQKPRKEIVNQNNQYPNLRLTTSAVNRKKQQRQIDLDNQVLKRKIEAIALRRPQAQIL